jgi:hypothetical protein
VAGVKHRRLGQSGAAVVLRVNVWFTNPLHGFMIIILYFADCCTCSERINCEESCPISIGVDDMNSPEMRNKSGGYALLLRLLTPPYAFVRPSYPLYDLMSIPVDTVSIVPEKMRNSSTG